MTHPEGMPTNPEGDVSPDDISRLVHTAQALLPPPQIYIYTDQFIEEPEIEEESEAAYKVGGDGQQVFVTIRQYGSTNGRHELSVSKVILEYEDNVGTVQVKEVYDVDLYDLEPSHDRIIVPIIKNPSSAPRTDEEWQARIEDILANATLAHNLGLHRFTQGHFEEVMVLLQKCGPHNRVPIS